MTSTPPSQHPEPSDNALTRASAPAVRWISSLPPVVPVLFVFALVLAGGFIQPWGWVFLALASLILLWVLALSWPRLTHSERLLRIAVIALVIAVTVVRAVPR